MSYELDAEGTNGVNDTTVVVTLGNFHLPMPPPNSTGEAPSKAVWVVDASPLTSAPPAGPVDGILSLAGAGGGRGIVASGDGAGVSASSRNNIGVLSSAPNGVFAAGEADAQGNPGVGVVGQASVVGSGVVGWGGRIPTGWPPARLSFWSGIVGVFGCIADGEVFPPSDPNGPFNSVIAGVWGDATNENLASVGVLGTSQNGRGGMFQATNGAQLRLVPSTTKLEDNTFLLQNGQPGDLYLYSSFHQAGTVGTLTFDTILWLCIAPASPGGQATWAQVELSSPIGGC